MAQQYSPQDHGARCSSCPLNGQPVVPPTIPEGKIRLAIVGEGPGKIEIREKRGFVGPSGRLLDSMLEEAGFDRREALISNAVLCRVDDERDLPRASACCSMRLANELAVLPPQVPTLALGASAAKATIGKGGILKARGFIWKVDAVKPAALKAAARTVDKRRATRKSAFNDERLAKAESSYWLLQARAKLEGRIVIPSLHPAFLLRGADAWAPLLRVDVKRAVRYAEKPLKLEDDVAFIETSDINIVRRHLARLPKVVSLDVETDGPDPLHAKLDCIGVVGVDVDRGVLTGPALVMNPWRRAFGPLLNHALKERVVVGHNLISFDETVCRRYGIHFTGGKEDTLLAHHSFASHVRQGLDHVASVYCDAQPWKQIHKSRGNDEKGQGFAVKELARYNASDVGLTALSWVRMQPDLAPERSVYESSKKLATFCTGMQRAGLRVDVARRDFLARKLRSRAAGLKGEMRKMLARPGFNPRKTVDIRWALFEKFRSPLLALTPTGMPSTAAGTLEALQKIESPAGKLSDLIIRYRACEKTVSTFLEGIDIARDGRVHASWRAFGTVCMPAGELVLTDRGYIAVENVGVSDLVISHTGAQRAVVECVTNAPAPIYRVELSNGLVLRTTPNHPYRVGDGWVSADSLRIGDVVTTHSAKEEWREVKGWPYEVSSWGRVRRIAGKCTGVVVRQHPCGTWGHLKVTLSRNGAQKRGVDKRDVKVHHLVLEAFGRSRRRGAEGRHLNGIAWDNTAANLAWGTSKDNKADGRRHGVMSKRLGAQAKLTQVAVDEIRSAPPPQERGDAYASDRAFAKKFGVTRELVRDVRLSKRWLPEDFVEGKRVTFGSARVVSISVEAPAVTYGLTVDVDHSHVTGGIVTHNTQRLSCRDPNLQNLVRRVLLEYLIKMSASVKPGKAAAAKALIKELGDDAYELESRVREIYVAAPGHAFVYFDLAQSEMRAAAYLSGDDRFIASCESGDVHTANARILFPDAARELEDPKGAGKPFRDVTKNAGFGILYDATIATIFSFLQSKGFDVSLGDVEAMFNEIRSAYARYYEFCEENLEACRKRGYLREALSGRIRHFGFYPKPTEIFNYMVQAFIAALMNERLLVIDSRLPRGARTVAQVHDSGVIETPLALVDDVKALVVDVWKDKVSVPTSGREFVMPIDLKVGERLSDF